METVHGRRRFLPGLAAASAAERAHAERQAVNTACQASAADLMKAAELEIRLLSSGLRFGLMSMDFMRFGSPLMSPIIPHQKMYWTQCRSIWGPLEQVKR